MKAVVLALILASPAAAQTIGGPHKPSNQIGGPVAPKNFAVAPPRGAPALPTTPMSKPLTQKPAAPPHPPTIQRNAVPEPIKPKQPTRTNG
jgi:hypothetical protein